MFKLSDGTWKIPYSIDNKVDRRLIETTRKMYQGEYAGAYDFYRFRLDDEEVIEIRSKFSYEEIWKIWTDDGGRIGGAWGFKFKEDDEEWNKHVMIMSMLLTFRKNKTQGTGDSELDKNLAYDFILTSLARLGADTHRNPKERLKASSTIKGLIERYNLPQIEADKFKKILNSSDKQREESKNLMTKRGNKP